MTSGADWWPIGHAIPRPEWGEYRSEEWQRIRSDGVYTGCSDVAAILGLHPWQGPLTTWRALIGHEVQRERTEEDQEKMDLGLDIEQAILNAWRRKTPEVVDHWRTRRTYSHPRIPILGGSFDAVGRLSDGQQVLAEFKHVYWRAQDDVDAYEERGVLQGMLVPIYVQCQAQLAVSGLELNYACILIEKRTNILPLGRDEPMIQRIEREIPAFFNRFVATGVEPPAGEYDVKHLRAFYPDVEPGQIVERPDLLPLVAKGREIKLRLARARADVRATEKELAPISAQLMQALGKAEVLRVGGGEKDVTWKADKRGRRTMRY